MRNEMRFSKTAKDRRKKKRDTKKKKREERERERQKERMKERKKITNVYLWSVPSWDECHSQLSQRLQSLPFQIFLPAMSK
jgi:hypothetical protein